MDFAAPADYKITLKEGEKWGKYLDIARELKKRNTVEQESNGYTNCSWCFATVAKGLLKWPEDLEIRELEETIQSAALLRSAKILRRVLETWVDQLSLKLQWKTIG